MRARRRTTIDLELLATTPLHVGAGEGRLGPDQVLATNAAGLWIVPGTSLAGALRQRVHRLAPDEVDGLFGYVRRDDDRAHASRVGVADAAVVLPAGVTAQVVTGVAIDRISGTAADRYLYDRMVLPAGSRVRGQLVIDDPDLDADGRGVATQRLLRVLAGVRRTGVAAGTNPSGSPLWLGAGTSRGLGALMLDADASSFRELDLGGPGILDGLYGEAGSRPLAAVLDEVEPLADPDLLSIRVAFTPRGPLMIRGEHPSTFKAVPRFAWDGERYALSLPGTSLKGVLRQAAERIVTTITGEQVADPVALDDPRALLDQHDQPLVDRLFGTVKRDGGGRRGAIHIRDMYAVSDAHRLTAEQLGDLLAVGTRQGFDLGMHVALDRFTGGAAEGLLFSVVEPHGVCWPAIEIEVDLERLAAAEAEDGTEQPATTWAAVGLLLLVIGELQAGMHGIGAFAERGHGDIEVTDVSVLLDDAVDLDAPVDAPGPLPEPPDGWQIPQRVWQAAAAGWTSWARAHLDTEG